MTVVVASSPAGEGMLLEEADVFNAWKMLDLREKGNDNLPSVYQSPSADLELVEWESEPWGWVIVLGFVAYAATLYWADRCRHQGGEPYTALTWRGFIVSCRG